MKYYDKSMYQTEQHVRIIVTILIAFIIGFLIGYGVEEQNWLIRKQKIKIKCKCSTRE